VAEPDAAPSSNESDPTESATLALLRVVAASADDAFIFTDLDARVRVWNAAAERLYGIPAEDAVGRDIYGLTDATVVGDVDVPTWLPREIALATGAWHGRVIERPKVGRAVGHEVVVEATLSRLIDERGEIDGILNIKRDITASYRLERELATLGSLATATGQARSRAEIAQAAIDLLCTATGAPYGVIIRLDGDDPVLEAVHGVDPDTSARALELTRRGAPMLDAVEPRGQVVIGDLDAVPIRSEAREWLRTTGLATIAAVGIHRRDDLVGVLAMGWIDPDAPRPSSATLLQASAHVERALENARLVEEITRQAEAEQALLRRLDALDELTRIGQSVQTAEELAEQSARLVGEALEANGTAYGLFNPDGSGYETSRAIGIRKPIAEWLATAAPAERSVVRRWQKGEGSILERFEPGVVTEETLAIARKSGVTAYAAIPIRVEDQLVGGIVAYFEGAPDKLHVNSAALDSVARIVGISLANFRHRERFAESEKRYRTLFEASPDAYLLCDEKRWIIDANAAGARLLGLPVEELRGRPIGDFLRSDESSRARALDLISREGRGVFVGVGNRADGSAFPREAEVAQIDLGRGPGYLVRIRDLTEQQRLQSELVQAQKMETVGILVSGVAHELNNPIASIIGLSTLIGRDPSLTADLRESAGLLVEEAQRAGQIVRTFLDFVRSRPPERHPTPMKPLLETVRELQSYSQKSGVEWVIDVEPGLPRVAIDRSQIQQVLINLTTNAIQAILSDRPVGRLEVVVRRGPRSDGRATVRITVTDDGPGVAASDRTKLFVPFFTTKAPGEGTGLGLPVSFDIIRRHEGRLWFEPAPGGRGARFVIDLPVQVTSPARAGATNAPAVRSARSPGRKRRESGRHRTADLSGRQPRALVLDDEASIRTFLRKTLIAAGFDAIVAADSETAVSEVRRSPIDVALVDHRMPGMTGIDAYEAAVAIQPSLSERWIFMSGDVLNPDLLEFAEARAIPLLAKPFDLATVTRSVREVVDRLGLAD
jgi:two-component system NtrC family sensor kinase